MMVYIFLWSMFSFQSLWTCWYLYLCSTCFAFSFCVHGGILTTVLCVLLLAFGIGYIPWHSRPICFGFSLCGMLIYIHVMYALANANLVYRLKIRILLLLLILLLLVWAFVNMMVYIPLSCMFSFQPLRTCGYTYLCDACFILAFVDM